MRDSDTAREIQQRLLEDEASTAPERAQTARALAERASLKLRRKLAERQPSNGI